MSVYTDAITADTPSLWWWMNEASGNPQDSSGNGNHVTGTAGTRTYGVEGVMGTAAIMGSAASVNHMTKTGMTAAPASTITVAAAVRMTGPLTNSAIFMWFGWTTSGGWLLQETATGVMFGVMDNGVPSQINATASVTVPRDGAYHRVVGTYDGTAPKVYLDGDLRATGSTSAGIALATGAVSMFVMQPKTSQTVELDEFVVIPSAWDLARVQADDAFFPGADQGFPSAESLGFPHRQRAPMPMIVGPREDRIMSMQSRRKG